MKELIGIGIGILVALFMFLIFVASTKIGIVNKPLPRFDDEQQRIEDEEVELNNTSEENNKEY